MGMFDYVKSTHPAIPAEQNYQTKSLDCTLDTFIVRPEGLFQDGRLCREITQEVVIYSEDTFKVDVMRGRVTAVSRAGADRNDWRIVWWPGIDQADRNKNAAVKKIAAIIREGIDHDASPEDVAFRLANALRSNEITDEDIFLNGVDE